MSGPGRDGILRIDAGQRERARAGLCKRMQHCPWPKDTWFPVSIAPRDEPLELCVIEGAETCCLVFPCRKDGRRWVDCETQEVVDVAPTHWRPWPRVPDPIRSY